MGFSDPLNDRKAEACAADFALDILGSIEPLKDTRAICDGNDWTTITNVQTHSRVFARNRSRDPCSWRRILQRVVNQFPERRQHELAIGKNRLFVSRHHDLHPLPLDRVRNVVRPQPRSASRARQGQVVA